MKRESLNSLRQNLPLAKNFTAPIQDNFHRNLEGICIFQQRQKLPIAIELRVSNPVLTAMQAIPARKISRLRKSLTELYLA